MSWSFAALLVRIALAYLLANNASSQNTPLKENIAKAVFDLTSKLNQLLYKKIQPSGNILFSPITIYSELVLIHLGADGDTRDEIAHLLGLPKDISTVKQTHKTFSQILRALHYTKTNDTMDSNGEWVELRDTNIDFANAIFVQKGVSLTKSYASQVRSYYKANVTEVDFAKESSKATDIFNKFVSKNTYGTIPRLLSSPLENNTVALIAVCLHFKAAWILEFNKTFTKQENFNTGSGNVLTQMMTFRDDVRYIHLPELKVEAIELLFLHGDASTYFVLPYSNQTLDKVVSSLNGANLHRFVSESQSTTYVNYKIPRMKYKWSSDIKNSLADLGIKDLFSNNAKLNNMVNIDNPLKVSHVIHAAQIEFNEKGIAGVKAQSHKKPVKHNSEPIPFYVNRPFLFFVYNNKTDTILYSGAIHNPNSVSN